METILFNSQVFGKKCSVQGGTSSSSSSTALAQNIADEPMEPHGPIALGSGASSSSVGISGVPKGNDLSCDKRKFILDCLQKIQCDNATSTFLFELASIYQKLGDTDKSKLVLESMQTPQWLSLSNLDYQQTQTQRLLQLDLVITYLDMGDYEKATSFFSMVSEQFSQVDHDYYKEYPDISLKLAEIYWRLEAYDNSEYILNVLKGHVEESVQLGVIDLCVKLYPMDSSSFFKDVLSNMIEITYINRELEFLNTLFSFHSSSLKSLQTFEPLSLDSIIPSVEKFSKWLRKLNVDSEIVKNLGLKLKDANDVLEVATKRVELVTVQLKALEKQVENECKDVRTGDILVSLLENERKQLAKEKRLKNEAEEKVNKQFELYNETEIYLRNSKIDLPFLAQEVYLRNIMKGLYLLPEEIKEAIIMKVEEVVPDELRDSMKDLRLLAEQIYLTNSMKDLYLLPEEIKEAIIMQYEKEMSYDEIVQGKQASEDNAVKEQLFAQLKVFNLLLSQKKGLFQNNDFPDLTYLEVPMFLERNFGFVDGNDVFNSRWPINLEKIEQVYNGLDWHEDSNYISVRAKLVSSLSRIPSFRACYFEDFNNDNNPAVLINLLKTCNGDDVDLINSVLTRMQSQKSLSIHQRIDLAKTCYKIGRQHHASSFLNQVSISLGLTKEDIAKKLSARNLKFSSAAMVRNTVDLLFQLADAYCDCEDFAVATNLIAYAKKLEFDDILLLDNKELKKVLSDLNLEQLATALVGADQGLFSKISDNLTKDARDMVGQYLELKSEASNESHIEAAQDAIIKVLRKLDAQGNIKDDNRPFVSLRDLSKIQTLVYLKIGQQDKAYQRLNDLICHSDSNIQMKGLAILNYVLDS